MPSTYTPPAIPATRPTSRPTSRRHPASPVHLLLLALSLAALAVGPATASPPAIDPQDPHRFVKDGAPWYPAGYYPGLGTFTTRAPGGTSLMGYATLLIDQLAAHRLNYFRAVFTMGQPYRTGQGYQQTFPYQRTGPGTANDGGLKFDLDLFDEAHFDYWRSVLKYAAANGVTVQLTLLDSWHNNHFENPEEPDWGLRFDFYHGANNVNGLDVTSEDAWHSTAKNSQAFARHKALIEKAVDELGMFDNLVWEVCNEAGRGGEPGSFLEWEMQLADVITAREVFNGYPRHLVMPRDLLNHQQAKGQKGLNVEVHHQELAEQFGMVSSPLIADNDAGGTHFTNPQGRRKKAWAVLTAGAHMDYFQLGLGDVPVLTSSNTTEGMRYIGYTRKFLDDLDVTLRGMEPHDELVTAGAWAFARPGDEYVIYMRKNDGNTQVTVTGLPASYTATWFNPRSGTTQPAGTGPTFSPPSSPDNDWVLHVVAENLPPTACFTHACGGSTCDFDASCSTDDSGIVSYAWQFGDGATGSGVAPSHTYSGGGPYTVTLTVTDAGGEQDTYSQTVSVPGVCVPGAETLCLRAARFRVQLAWSNPANGTSGDGQAVTYSDKSGFFRFANPANVEAAVKVLGPVAGKFWVFHGPLTDLDYVVTVTDTHTGAVRSYAKPAGSLCGAGDTTAFDAAAAGVLEIPNAAVVAPLAGRDLAPPLMAKGTCDPAGSSHACLLGDRFRVEVRRGGLAQPGTEVSDLSAAFWFGASDNVEVVVKVLDGRPVNGSFWVFYGALTHQDYEVVVTDTVTGAVNTYQRPAPHCGEADTSAF